MLTARVERLVNVVIVVVGGRIGVANKPRRYRRLAFEQFESRLLLTGWHNDDISTDVDGNGNISIVDATSSIEVVREQGFGPLAQDATDPPQVDVDNDGRLSRVDVFAVIESVRNRFNHSEVLIRDDFVGPLDSQTWLLPEGDGTFFGRTQIKPPANPPSIVNGKLRLALDLYNPTAEVAGDSFLGAEIRSTEQFVADAEHGISLRARVQWGQDMPRGIVGGVFFYGLDTGTTIRDEIDFELLTNDADSANSKVFTNVYNDVDINGNNIGNTGHEAVAGFAPESTMHDLEIQWFDDRIQWFVDGVRIRVVQIDVPDEPMDVRLNIWAPRDGGFQTAFDASLQPVDDAANNETYFFDIDRVEVVRIPKP